MKAIGNKDDSFTCLTQKYPRTSRTFAMGIFNFSDEQTQGDLFNMIKELPLAQRRKVLDDILTAVSKADTGGYAEEIDPCSYLLSKVSSPAEITLGMFVLAESEKDENLQNKLLSCIKRLPEKHQHKAILDQKNQSGISLMDLIKEFGTPAIQARAVDIMHAAS